MKIEFMRAPEGTGFGGAADPELSPFEEPFQIDEAQETAGPSVDEIKSQLAELQKANEDLRAKADQASQLSGSFNQFGERLEKIVSRPAPAAPIQQQPGESLEAFKERINRKYLEDPYETMVEFSNRYVGGALQTMAQQSMQLQRKLAYLEADDKDFVRKHQDEIEQEVARIPVDQQMRDPEAYKRAMDTVRARHMDEIIAIKVAEAIAKATGAAPAAPAAARSPLGASETPVIPGAPASSPAGSSSSRRVSLTPAQIARLEARQKLEGMTQMNRNDYAEMLMDEGIDITKL